MSFDDPVLEVQADFELRKHQREINADDSRFRAIVLHRRSGKSVFCVAKLFEMATANDHVGYQLAYVAPSYKQAKAISWIYAEQFAACIPGAKLNKADLQVKLPGGATIDLLGVEQVDSLRGRRLDGCVIDEAQLMPTSVLFYVLLPCLADRKGFVIISGTPAGRHNLLAHCFFDDEFSSHSYTVHQTDALDPEEIARQRRVLSDEAFRQEYENDFDVALAGAYYAKECGAIINENRLTQVRRDDQLPIVMAVDLGHRDLFPCLWAQDIGTETRIIHAKAYRFASIPEIIRDWKDSGLPLPDKVILPHDAKVTALTDGKTREEIFIQHGFQTQVLDNISLDEGIEATRQLLRHLWIDGDCQIVWEALAAYRSDYDEEKQVHSLSPRHDWASHWADAVRYLALGNRRVGVYGGPRPKLRTGLTT